MCNARRFAAPLCIAAVLCLALALSQSGCAVVAYLTAQIHGPEKIPAKYTLDASLKTLVLVDAPRSPEVVKRLLTQALNKELVARELLKDVVPYADVVALRTRTPEYNRLAVTEVGEKLGASNVICVHINTFQLKDNPLDVLWHGQMETRVKVVAVTDGNTTARLWPTDSPAGHAVGPVQRDETTNASGAYATALTKSLCAEMADEIAKLFYRHDRTGIHAYGDRPTDADAIQQ